jgi:pimeloyl-ACP methyl ester carboxylesterase
MLLMLGAHSEIRARMGADAGEEFFRSVFRDVRIVTLPDAGHMMHLEVPEAIARHIVEFAGSRSRTR